jgi:four helix bundle protein
LKVWQKLYGLCLEIYRITPKFPKEERYGLTSQIRRSVVSIPSNIAEGYGRKTTLESLTPGILGPSSPTKLEKNHS